jgi:type VI secretion system secreted protein Hcp
MAAVDYFLKIDGIKGESQDHKHKDEIDVLSWSFGATQSGSMAYGGGGGAGKVSMQDLHFVKRVDAASPLLFLKCAGGDHIKEAVLVARKAGGDQQEYMTVKLSNLLISSYQSGGNQGEVVPTDQVSLNFQKIEIEYKQQDEKGKLGAASKAGWDLKTNKKV